MVKIPKNQKMKTWNVFAANGESLGSYTFHAAEAKAYFPGARIEKQNIYLP